MREFFPEAAIRQLETSYKSHYSSCMLLTITDHQANAYLHHEIIKIIVITFFYVTLDRALIFLFFFLSYRKLFQFSLQLGNPKSK